MEVLMIIVAGAAVLALGLGFEKLVRWGEGEGIVNRGYAGEDHGHAQELHEGDRVVAIGKVDGIDLGGLEGTVVRVEAHGCIPYGVEFDEPIVEGHSCFGSGKMGHCRFGELKDFRKVR